jgi:hypothetical protein
MTDCLRVAMPPVLLSFLAERNETAVTRDEAQPHVLRRAMRRERA